MLLLLEARRTKELFQMKLNLRAKSKGLDFLKFQVKLKWLLLNQI